MGHGGSPSLRLLGQEPDGGTSGLSSGFCWNGVCRMCSRAGSVRLPRREGQSNPRKRARRRTQVLGEE
ncbi:Uncharacterized protein ToN1_38840 [Aromatoleum petrolei]|nr:Uncharacterized protein ToN1_38840 [Aromatoleum petrolei]